MANKMKPSSLSKITDYKNLSGNEFFPVYLTGENFSITLDVLKKYIGVSGGGTAYVDFTSIDSNVIPDTDNTRILGNTNKSWKSLTLGDALFFKKGDEVVSLQFGTSATLRVNGSLEIDGGLTIGEYSLSSLLDDKQNRISDLNTIRSNSQLGAEAHGWGNHAEAGYATNSSVTQKLAQKQAKLTTSYGVDLSNSNTLSIRLGTYTELSYDDTGIVFSTGISEGENLGVAFNHAGGLYIKLGDGLAYGDNGEIVNTREASKDVDLSGYYTKSETDSKVDALKNDILGGASGAYDTLKEIETILTENEGEIGSLLTVIDEYSSKFQGEIDGLWSRNSFEELLIGHAAADTMAVVEMFADKLNIGEAVLQYDSYNEGLALSTSLYIEGSEVALVSQLATAEQKSEWNEAYGWGNHASQGYAKSSELGSFAKKNSLAASDIPDLSGTYQTKITSTNKLSSSLVSGLGAASGYGVSQNDFTASDGNLVVGAAVYSHVTNRLKGYATQDWVNGKNYLTYITSAQVTNALGYTPYNSTNPSGYYKSGDSPTFNTITLNGVTLALGSGITLNDKNLAVAGSISEGGTLLSNKYQPIGNYQPAGDYLTSANIGTAINDAIANYGFATVATTGSYNDLSDKPFIPNIDTLINDGLATRYDVAEVNAKFANYLPLSGGGINGSLYIGTPLNTSYQKILLRRNGYGLKINNTGQNAYLSLGSLNSDSLDISAMYVLAFGEEGLKYSSDNATYHTLIHSGNIGSQNVASATKLKGQSAGGVVDANTLFNDEQSVRYRSAISNESTNIPVANVWQNAILELGLHPNGSTAQLYFSKGESLYYRANIDEAWRKVLDDINLGDVVSTGLSFTSNLLSVNTDWLKSTVGVYTMYKNEDYTTYKLNTFGLVNNAGPYITFGSSDKYKATLRTTSGEVLQVRKVFETIDSGWKTVAFTDSTVAAANKIVDSSNNTLLHQASGFITATGGLRIGNNHQYCGLYPNIKITSAGNEKDLWLYNQENLRLFGATGVSINVSQNANIILASSNGNVGVGTTEPEALLHVAGNAIVNGDILVKGQIGGNNNAWRIVKSGGTLYLQAQDANGGNNGSIALCGHNATKASKITLYSGDIYLQGDVRSDGNITSGGSICLNIANTSFECIKGSSAYQSVLFSSDGSNFYTLGAACSYGVTSSVTSGSSSLVTSGGVASALSGYLPLNGGVMNLASALELKGVNDIKLVFNNTDGEKYQRILFRENGVDYGEILATSEAIRFSFPKALLRGFDILHSGNYTTYLDGYAPMSSVEAVADHLTSTQGQVVELSTKLVLLEKWVGDLEGDYFEAKESLQGQINGLLSNWANGVSSFKTDKIICKSNSNYSVAIGSIQLSSDMTGMSLYNSSESYVSLGGESNPWYGVYAYSFNNTSDATKKNILGDVNLSVNSLANAPAKVFTWKDGLDARRHVGTIAQYWRDVLPEVVSGKEGSMSMNYAELAVVSSIILARNVETHEQRIERLEREITNLQNELDELRKNSE